PPPAVAPQAEQSELGDYKLYTLPFPTTVAARQTKQLLMMKAEGVAFDRVYRFSTWPGSSFSADGRPLAVDLLMRMKNSKASGLGLPIPGGNATITQETPNGALIAGSYKFENSPVGSPFDLTLASSRQVEVTPVLVSDVTKGKRNREFTYAIEAVNHTAAPAAFEVRVMQSYQVFKITNATVKPVSRDGGRVMAVVLAPGERRTLRYTVRITQ
ncbi:hypothetical protein GVN21_14930, partial [Caulobacter sp. SLTY]|nr:hypothetical protein [Caulobacter sp. SLTY]